MTGGKRREEVIGLGEKLFGVCALLYSSAAFLRLLLPEEQYAAAGEDILGSPLKRVVWPVLYFLSGYFLLRSGRHRLNILTRLPLLTILLLYLGLSISWSESRFVSVLSAGALTGNTLMGLYFGTRYDVPELLRLLGKVYIVIVGSAFFARMALGGEALVDGLWAGFFTQRNALGMNAAIGLLVFTILWRTATNRKWLWAGLAALSASLVVLSGSATCILALLLVACVYFWRAFLKKHVHSTSLQVLVSTVVLICCVAVFLSQWDGILSAFGKDENLTGRTEIWGASMMMAQDKPLFGYGYGGFWIFDGPAQTIWDALGKDPTVYSYSHNGYLQILLDAGIVGLCLLLALVASAFRKAWTYAKVTNDVWPLCFFAFMAFHNLGEGTYAERNSLCWLLFVALLVQLGRAPEAERVAAVRLRAVPLLQALPPGEV